MVHRLKRVSIKAPAVLVREIISLCSGAPSSVKDTQNELMSEASRDEADVVIEYDSIYPVQVWFAGILKLAAITAVIAIVWIIKRG